MRRWGHATTVRSETFHCAMAHYTVRKQHGASRPTDKQTNAGKRSIQASANQKWDNELPWGRSVLSECISTWVFYLSSVWAYNIWIEIYVHKWKLSHLFLVIFHTRANDIYSESSHINNFPWAQMFIVNSSNSFHSSYPNQCAHNKSVSNIQINICIYILTIHIIYVKFSKPYCVTQIR